jgi:hypothetical protein
MKKSTKPTKAQLERRRVEETARLDRLLDNVPLRTLVKSARAILAGMPSMQGIAYQLTAHERRLSELESTASAGNLFAAEGEPSER